MLILTFRIGGQRFGLRASDILEVIPAVELSLPPKAPRGLAGLLDYRGRMTPVLDLCALALDRPCAPAMSTRVIVVRYRTPGRDLAVRPLGLLAEQATAVIRILPSELEEPGMAFPEARWLGQVTHDGDGLIQLVEPVHLLPEETRALLFPGEDSHG